MMGDVVRVPLAAKSQRDACCSIGEEGQADMVCIGHGMLVVCILCVCRMV